MKTQEKKEAETQPSSLDGSLEANKDGQIRGEFEEQSKKKIIIRRSLISPPYSTPRFVFKRVKDFNMQVLAGRYSKPLEEVRNDFQQLDRCVEPLLALGAVRHFEFQLEDTDVIIDMVESFDKSSEDMSPPILGILGTLDHVEPKLTIRLKESSSLCASIVKISETLELKIVKLQFSEPEGVIQKAAVEKA